AEQARPRVELELSIRNARADSTVAATPVSVVGAPPLLGLARPIATVVVVAPVLPVPLDHLAKTI
ncbi:hypothetical protein PanWU01x14_261720, partial [Parasponia andersonii]